MPGKTGRGQVCEPLTVLSASHLASSSDEVLVARARNKKLQAKAGLVAGPGVPSKLSKQDRFITSRVAGQLVCDQLLVKVPVPVSRGPLTLELDAGKFWYHMRVGHLPRHVFVGGQ